MRELHDPQLLDEIDHLFAQDEIVDTEAPDARWNCFAKAYACMWLTRIWGQPTDMYSGELLVGSLQGGVVNAWRVTPHAWTGLSEKRIVDISIRNIANEPYIVVVGSLVHAVRKWTLYVEVDSCRFDQFASGALRFRDADFLIFLPRERIAFHPNSIFDRHATKSPASFRMLSRFSENLLPKAILHIHLFAEGTMESLRGLTPVESYERLQKWQIDPIVELKKLV